MSDFFDNMCRTLATPMSRTTAVKVILGAAAGAVLAPFGFKGALVYGQQSCPSPPACPTGYTKCNDANKGGKVTPNCQDCCPPGTTCCRKGDKADCCDSTEVCNNGTC